MLGPFIFLLSVLFPAEWLAAMSDIAQKGGEEGGGQGEKSCRAKAFRALLPPFLPGPLKMDPCTAVRVALCTLQKCSHKNWVGYILKILIIFYEY